MMKKCSGSELFSEYFETQGRARDEDVKELEDLVGARLPDDYRKFLLETNGGFVRINAQFSFGEEMTFLHTVLGVGYVRKTYLIAESLKNFPELVEAKMLPIANDPLGATICISLRDDDIGNVWFYNWVEKGRDVGKISFIASGFTEFIELLEPYFEWHDMPAIARKRISKWESGNRITLPPDYKAFLEQHNGRRALSHICFETADGDGLWQLDRILGIGHSILNRKMDVDACRRRYRKWVGAEFLPIAVHRLESLICYEVVDGKCERIFFLREEGEDPCPLADTFTAFLDCFWPCPHPDPDAFNNTEDQYVWKGD